MSKPPPLTPKRAPAPAMPPPLRVPASDVPSVESELQKIGFTASVSRGRKLEFSGEHSGQHVTGSLEARTRTKYYGEIRRRQLSGFRLFVEAPAQTEGRLILVHKTTASRLTRWLNRKGNVFPITVPAALPNLEAWAADVEWAERLMHDPEMIPHLAALIPDRSFTKNHSLQWYADKVSYSSFGSKGSQALLIADAVARVAAITARCKTLPMATRKHQPGWMERRPLLVVGLIIGGVLLIAGLATLALVLISILISR